MTAQLRADAQPAALSLMAFRVTIKNGRTEVRGFEAMGHHAVTVAEQHESLCSEGEYIEVESLAKWRARLAAKFAGPLEKAAAQRRTVRGILAAQSAPDAVAAHHADEYATGLDRVGPEWDGEEDDDDLSRAVDQRRGAL